jgi:nucleoside-diphosphate-sugar epimerase
MADRRVLVLGATGGVGGEVARRLKGRGWAVSALHRDPARVGSRDGLTWVPGDALVASDVANAAEGCDLIVHAVNPPGYRNWGEVVLPMLDNSIAAARQNGARILLPGTIYNYGPLAFPLLDETSVQQPVSRKGRIRVEMEARLLDASTRGAKALIVRAGDYFGPRAGNNWFSQGLVKAGHPVTVITYPGGPGIGHQWAYLPDVAETMVRLVEDADLDAFATFHTGGHWDHDGRQMIEAIKRVIGSPHLPVRPLPWRLMALASPFVPLFRELREVRYLWDQPVRMTNDRLRAAIGIEPHTPLDEAVGATLMALGCLKESKAPNASGVLPSQGRL